MSRKLLSKDASLLGSMGEGPKHFYSISCQPVNLCFVSAKKARSLINKHEIYEVALKASVENNLKICMKALEFDKM